MALAGAVVSNPIPKKTTCRSGFSLATLSASSGEYTTRTSPPRLLIPKRSASLPGTRSMSPNEQKITSGRSAMASALSIMSSGVTQTGHPGPWTISMSSGRRRSIPLRMIEWVWPPQTSMRTQCLVVMTAISSRSRLARSGSRNSSRYFTRTLRPARFALLRPVPPPGRVRSRGRRARESGRGSRERIAHRAW